MRGDQSHRLFGPIRRIETREQIGNPVSDTTRHVLQPLYQRDPYLMVVVLAASQVFHGLSRVMVHARDDVNGSSILVDDPHGIFRPLEPRGGFFHHSRYLALARRYAVHVGQLVVEFLLSSSLPYGCMLLESLMHEV